MQIVFYMIGAMIVGALVSAQPPLNAILARAVGSAYGATAVSVFVAFVCTLLLLIVKGSGSVNVQTLASVPWWVYFAGVVGAIFVGAGVVIAPVTGALVFFVCVVAGQLIGSTLADHFGAFGLEVREVSIPRLLGIVLVLVGAVIVGRA